MLIAFKFAPVAVHQAARVVRPILIHPRTFSSNRPERIQFVNNGGGLGRTLLAR